MDILKQIQSFESITIFRHQVADQDALGSQFGLKTFIEEHFPEKKVYALGESAGSCAYLFPAIDQVSDEVIANSLAIVLDCANRDRIDDERALTAKKIIKIDHHIVVDEYAQESYVDVKATATCEILANMLQESGLALSSTCATYLYYGILADSLSFTTSNTSANTLRSAAFLVECGVDVTQVRSAMQGKKESEFYYINDICSKVQKQGKVAYSIMCEEEYQKYGLSYNEAKEKVFALADVKEFAIWCLFTEDKQYGDAMFNGSLRSRNIALNEVANRFGGGGHKNACGVKKLTVEDIDRLVKELDALS